MIEGGKLVQGKRLSDRQPAVSVITVCFNCAHLLEGCIESVKNQMTPDVEYIIIDGGSTDGTVEIIKENSQYIDYWRSEKDEGIYDAMNKATRFARGRWLLFLGADDKLLPEFSQMPLLIKDEHVIYYGNAKVNNRIVGKEMSGYQLAKNNICHQAIFYPGAVFNKYQYDNRFPVCADHYLNLQCWIDEEFRFEYVPRLVADYGTEGFSSIYTDPTFEIERKKFIYKHFGISKYLAFLFRRLKKKLKEGNFMSIPGRK